jgi:hypothetical protein
VADLVTTCYGGRNRKVAAAYAQSKGQKVNKLAYITKLAWWFLECCSLFKLKFKIFYMKFDFIAGLKVNEDVVAKKLMPNLANYI